MRDWKQETNDRTAFIRSCLTRAGANGIVYGNSGGKDSALVGILCKKACENTVGIILPCQSKRNYGMDRDDALEAARQFEIETRQLDLTPVKQALTEALSGISELNEAASVNINPRLRMTALYAVAAAEHRLVAGTGNRSEAYLGYFTKWGDGAYDLNPISDLTVTEIYDYLDYLGAPECIRKKAPSAGLYDGQTDEEEMGISYAEVDRYLLTGKCEEAARSVIRTMHDRSEHKRRPLLNYPLK